MPLNPGARLGPYEIVSEIGAGGMGAVYRAKDTRLGRDVALKVLAESMAAGESRLQRFEREARAAGSLNHPNLVSVYDVGREDATSYIVSELVEGETLRQLLDRGAISPRRTADYGSQMADGLASAHNAGVAHRDMKPDHVMLTKEGRVKILDFGLARQPDPPAESDATVTSGPLTSPGMVMGTPGCMSPEQVRGEPADYRSDIFSLGLILFEMLTGMRAFGRETTVGEMSAVLKEDLPELSPEIPPAMAETVAHCVEKEPAMLEPEGCGSPAEWPADGEWILCHKEDNLRLISPDGAEPKIFKDVKIHSPAWSRDGQSVIGLRRKDGAHSLASLNVSTGAVRLITTYDRDFNLGTPVNPRTAVERVRGREERSGHAGYLRCGHPAADRVRPADLAAGQARAEVR